MNIKIDLSQLQNPWAFSPNVANSLIKTVLNAVTMEILAEWKMMAKNALKSSKNEYINSISFSDDGSLTNKIILLGSIANGIENGISAFDLKKGFENSSKAKTTKNGGWYLIIPFSHATSNAGGTGFASKIPRGIYEQLKKLPLDANGNSSALHVDNIKYPPKTRHEVANPNGGVFEAYTHKSSIHEGITRKRKKSNRSSYQTFRSVSDNSDPASWIHKGIRAHNLADKAMSGVNLNKIVDATINKLI